MKVEVEIFEFSKQAVSRQDEFESRSVFVGKIVTRVKVADVFVDS